jgi:acyl-CoA synthetase (NDP forming)
MGGLSQPIETDAAARFGGMLESESAVLVGASDRDDNLAGSRPIRIAATYESPVPLYQVNPKFAAGGDDGRRFPSISALPAVPDLGLLALPADAVVPALREGSELGIRRFVVFSAGFGHGSAREIERLELLRATIEENDLTVVGPGSLGFASLQRGLFATFSGAFQLGLKSGPVALVSQSGALITTISGYLHRAGIGLDVMVALGAQVQVTVEDALLAVAADRSHSIKTIVCFLEEVRDAEALMRAIELAGDERTIIFMSGGSTPIGASAARSHTGAQVGSYAMLRDLVTGAGAHWADSLPEMIEITRLSLAIPDPPAVRRVAIATNSGGAGVLSADALVREGFEVPPLGAATASALAEQLPDYIVPSSPLDFGDRLIRHPEELPGWIETLGEDPAVDAILLVVTSIFSQEEIHARAALDAVARTEVPVIPVFLPPLPGHGEFAASIEDAIAGLGALVRPAPRLEGGDDGGPPVGEARGVAIDEIAAKAMIEEIGGFSRPAHALLEEGVAPPADALGSLPSPYVVKLAAPGVGQRLSKGLVLRHVEGEAELAAAVAAIAERRPPGPPGKILVEQEIPEGLDLVLAAHRDPSFGPVLVMGLGGSFAGLFGGDLWIRSPRGPHEVLRALEQRRWWLQVCERMALTEADRMATAEGACALAAVLDRDEELVEIEVNPARIVDGRLWCLDGRATRQLTSTTKETA